MQTFISVSDSNLHGYDLGIIDLVDDGGWLKSVRRMSYICIYIYVCLTQTWLAGYDLVVIDLVDDGLAEIS